MSDAQQGFVVGDRILGQAADSHPDWCVGFGQLGRFTCFGASAIGKYHLRERRPRDDSFAIRTAGHWLAAVVADGAGSRPLSRYGSSFAVEALCEHLLREAAQLGAATSPPPTPTPEPVPPPAISEEEGEPLLMQVSPGDPAWSVSASTAKTLPLAGRDAAPTTPPTPSASPATNGAWARPATTPIAGPATAGTSAAAVPSTSKETASDAEVQAATERPAAPRPETFPDLPTPVDRPTTRHGTIAWHWSPPPLAFAEASPAAAPDPALAEAGLAGCVRRAFVSARKGLEGFASSRGLSLSDLHCTLLGLVLNTATGELAVGHIGDGLIGALRRDGTAGPLVEPPSTGQAGETYVVTQREWESYLGVAAHLAAEADELTACFLMTDGVADDCSYPPPPDIFDRWARDIDREVRADRPLPATATRLLNWLANYEARGSWDDRTLVVILRRGD